MDLLIGSVVAVGWQDDQAAVDRKRLQFDRESGTVFVREGSADLGPFLLGLTVAFVFFDGEDVEVGRENRWQGRELRGCGARSSLIWIAVVHGRIPCRWRARVCKGNCGGRGWGAE